MTENKVLVELLRGDPNSEEEPTIVEFPNEAEPFLRHFRWIDFRGNHVTPDVVQSDLFDPPVRKGEDNFASINEMVQWYLDLNLKERYDVLKKLAKTLPLQTDSESKIDMSSVDQVCQ